MSVGHLQFHMDHQNMLMDMECKRWKGIMDKLSINDDVEFYDNEHELIKGKITKFYNWYQMEVTEDSGRRWGVSAGSINIEMPK